MCMTCLKMRIYLILRNAFDSLPVFTLSFSSYWTFGQYMMRFTGPTIYSWQIYCMFTVPTHSLMDSGFGSMPKSKTDSLSNKQLLIAGVVETHFFFKLVLSSDLQHIQWLFSKATQTDCFNQFLVFQQDSNFNNCFSHI